jgi:hypothetical protein
LWAFGRLKREVLNASVARYCSLYIYGGLSAYT